MAMQSGKDYLSGLPNEVLIHILQLSYEQGSNRWTSAAAAVNRRLNTLYEPILYGKIRIINPDIKPILRGNIRTVILDVSKRPYRAASLALALKRQPARAQNITSLEIRGPPGMLTESILIRLASMDRLKSLILPGISHDMAFNFSTVFLVSARSDAVNIGRTLTELESVTIGCDFESSMEWVGLEWSLENSFSVLAHPTLSKLKIICGRMHSRTVIMPDFVEQKSNNLQHLDLYHCELSPAQLRRILEIPRGLKGLAITFNQRFGSYPRYAAREWVAALNPVQNSLESLRFSGFFINFFWHRNNGHANLDVSMKFLSALKDLTIQKHFFACRLSDDNIKNLLPASLENLIIENDTDGDQMFKKRGDSVLLTRLLRLLSQSGPSEMRDFLPKLKSVIVDPEYDMKGLNNLRDDYEPPRYLFDQLKNIGIVLKVRIPASNIPPFVLMREFYAPHSHLIMSG